ncbi:unnamed protein product [Chrysoparadoxa australica]
MDYQVKAEPVRYEPHPIQAPQMPLAAATKHSPASKKPGNVPGFITKTYEIFSNPKFDDICGWGPRGDTIIIKQVHLFSSQVLPLYFKHSNFQSFVRQLNMYDFHKTVQDPSHGEFQHPLFLKSQPQLLSKIKRKAPAGSAEGARQRKAVRPRPPPLVKSEQKGLSSLLQPVSSQKTHTSSKPKNPVHPEALVQESSAVLEELVELRRRQDEVEAQLTQSRADYSEMKAENESLWETLSKHSQNQEAMKQRMQRILCCVWDMYVESGGKPSGRLGALLQEEGVVKVDSVGGGALTRMNSVQQVAAPARRTPAITPTSASLKRNLDLLNMQLDVGEGNGQLSRQTSKDWVRGQYGKAADGPQLKRVKLKEGEEVESSSDLASSLNQLGEQEADTMTKIDSLGYQLAHLFALPEGEANFSNLFDAVPTEEMGNATEVIGNAPTPMPILNPPDADT